MERTTQNTQCPCCSGKPFQQCCQPYILEEQFPNTPELLMRSRYTAYTLGEIDYITKTMKGPALVGFNPIEAKQWSLNTKWTSLEILSAPSVPKTENIGFVTFQARYIEDNQAQILKEKSEFHRIDTQWYYHTEHSTLSAPVQQIIHKNKVGRNAPCPCNSGKKYKKCCYL